MHDNSVEDAFKGRVFIEAGTALLFFRKKGISQELIHHLKYKGRQDIGLFFGRWMVAEFLASDRFKSIDVIVKVPLHPKKKKSRGYNQLTTFAEELSKGLGVPVIDNVLVKIGKSTSQTKKSRFSRFEKIDEKFHLVDTKTLTGKHVLLIDDVLTTGATLEACANEILRTPKVKISIATMVISDHY
jgi:ComF family protein